ncbi:hypothetical protein IAG44_05695 [Streptomyces roseirectus]|uniref:Uncharacterized protein n=1 Tax=Streptomyces roseirectus TaxID=2768066 RepID=A0A7H0I876_9ACTN|nr:hypothetical protein IAG44_05695 [Streptomyces roseirectus]
MPARRFRLQDAPAVLELDRHRLGVRSARQNRLDLIARGTERLVARMTAAAELADAEVLLHLAKSPAVVGAARSLGDGTLDRAASVRGRISSGIAERARRRGGGGRERGEGE